MTLSESQKSSLIISILLHICFMLVLLIFTLKDDFAKIESDGLLVDFGYSDTGFGAEEPAPSISDIQSKTTKPEEQTVIEAAEPAKTDKKQEAKEILTQDHEPSVALNQQKKKEKTVEKKQKTVVKTDPIAIENQKKKNELLAQQQLAEKNRQQKLVEEKLIGSINTRAKNAFGGGTADDIGTSLGSSEGIAGGTGNQGVPEGSPGVKKYGPGGGIGDGISYNLSGRRAQSIPKPSYPGNEAGIVVVEVTVDKFGKVSSARPGIKGSTSNNPYLLEAARKAAVAAKFNVDDQAPAYQKGSITYRFVLE